MEITVSVALTDEQWRGIETQLRRLKPYASVVETPEQFTSRILQKTLDGWARSASDEFIAMNSAAFNTALDKMTSAPNSAQLLAALGLRVTNDGTLMFTNTAPTTRAQSGLYLGHGDFIGQPIAQAKKDGHSIIRIDLQRQDDDRTKMLAQEVLDHQMQPLCVIRRAEQMFALPEGALVELGGDEWDITSFVAAATDCIKIAEAKPRLRLFLGAAMIDARGFGFLSQLPWSDWPQTVGCIVYRETPGDSHDPKLGWPSREAEVETLKAIVGTRPLACVVSSQSFSWEHEFFSRHGFEIVTSA